MTSVDDTHAAAGTTPAQAGGQAGADPSTHFIFVSKVFALPGGYFCLAKDTGEAVFNVHLGDVWGKIPFRTMRETFDIDEKSQDGRLLGVVEKGLKFVKEIRPGDSIPRELLDGSASWRVDEQHLLIARGRLTLQLVSWISGKDEIITDRFKLLQMVEDPQTKAKTQEAFARLARQFGLPEERKQEMIDKVESLARELSYIEALRDRYGLVQKIMSSLGQARRVFKGDNTIQSDIARMQALAKVPIANFDDAFNQIDGQCAEVMAMLRSFDAQVAFIRRMRDELHTNLMIWDELIEDWNGHEVDKGPETEGLLKRTYQFLAQHFLISKVWSRNG
ncbi:hypothetical protein [Oleisolibacter albus]|uniref:hypothetical protein n=1 Tax=Oleisolibacter albus TaxID=2171757 RepID=UPI000DF2B947|nr:hypothetical protein [Oleisolibacter albus]